VNLFEKMFAYAGDEEQADIINQMGSSLSYVDKCAERMSPSASHEMQMCYIADKLDRHGEKFITHLAEFISVKKEERGK